jgi:predicted membrane GTPase involved in stress response
MSHHRARRSRKTTLVDQMLRDAGRAAQGRTIRRAHYDSNDLERERGITIL